MILPVEIECKVQNRESLVSLDASFASEEWFIDVSEIDVSEITDESDDDSVEGDSDDVSSTNLPLAVAGRSPHYSFWCPLSKLIMKEPVQTPLKYNFERSAILAHLRNNGNVCPLSGKPLRSMDLKPNSKLQWEILYWQRKEGSTRELYDATASPAGAMMPMRRLSRVDATLNSIPNHPSKIDSPPAAPRKRLNKSQTHATRPQQQLMSPPSLPPPPPASTPTPSLRRSPQPDVAPSPATRKTIKSNTTSKQQQQPKVVEKVDVPPFAPKRRDSDQDLKKTFEFSKRLSSASANKFLSFNLAMAHSEASKGPGIPNSLHAIPTTQGSTYDPETVLNILDQVIELGAF